jgi:hypothetical protein
MPRREVLKYLTPDEPPDTRLCRVFSVPNRADWLGVFMGAILPLTEARNWEKYGTVNPEDAADAFRSIFDAAFEETSECDMPTCCPIRYGADGHIQQQNPDTGEWSDVGTPPLPVRTPVEGQNEKCLASENAAEVVRQCWLAFEQQMASPISVLIAASAVITILLLTVLYPPSIVLVGVFFEELYGAWEAITDHEFSTDDRHTLACILYCNASGGDGTPITFDFAGVLAGVDELVNVLEPNVWLGVRIMLNAITSDALNRAAATTSITEADCSDCTACPWCYEWTDFTDFTQLTTGQGTESTVLQLMFGFTVPNLTDLEFEWSWNGLGAGGTEAYAAWVGDFTADRVIFGTDIATLHASWHGTHSAPGITAGINTSTGVGGAVSITKIRLKGNGDLPAFTGGSEC